MSYQEALEESCIAFDANKIAVEATDEEGGAAAMTTVWRPNANWATW
jgi:hypothetical protein